VSVVNTHFPLKRVTSELIRRFFFLLLALLVFRFGSHVPVPGINPRMLEQLFSVSRSGIFGLFNMFSGGSLSRFSVFALGVMPYISASIVVQLLTHVFGYFDSLRKEGESGRRRLAQYTRYGTIVLAFFQSLGIAYAIEAVQGLVMHPGLEFRFGVVISLVAGTVFLMWLGEQITERGLGNGISMLIFSGIASGFPTALVSLLELLRTGAMSLFSFLTVSIVVCIVTFFVVFVERGQRKIIINYAKRQVGGRFYSAQSSHLPLKLNMSGVIPPIFASSIILLPTTFIGWFFVGSPSLNWLKNISVIMMPGQPVYMFFYSIVIIFFCFFYTAIIFNSRETADNLKKSGGFIPGVRPGERTAKFIDKVLIRLTLLGALYILIVCLLPEFMVLQYGISFYFGGTSLLIIVVVTMDLLAQIQNYMLSGQYDSLLKKNNFKVR
jgi:preprotein translocase subunit SecY